MKNWEAYEEKIKELKTNIALMKNNELLPCTNVSCCECEFYNEDSDCSTNLFEWFYEEYKKPKIKIPLATKVILENLDERWKWIAKDKDGTVFVYESKPEKGDMSWTYTTGNSVWGWGSCLKKEVSNFLSWEDEEPANIKELLENCEVIEDEQ